MYKKITPKGNRGKRTIKPWSRVGFLSVLMINNIYHEHEVIQNEGIQFKVN